MRRVFIIRKDLHLKPGKLAAMVSHCAEAYWTSLLKAGQIVDNEFVTLPTKNSRDGKVVPAIYKNPEIYRLAQEALAEGKDSFTTLRQDPRLSFSITVEVPKSIWHDYVNGIFTKTICEARNLENMKKRVMPVVEELGLVEGVDYGYINDRCLTDLTPENEDGTCTVGMWFRPLPDEDAHKISKKFQLYKED